MDQLIPNLAKVRSPARKDNMASADAAPEIKQETGDEVLTPPCIEFLRSL